MGYLISLNDKYYFLKVLLLLLEYLNKFITVKYFEESYNSTTGIPSLRFPVFIRKREL